MVRLERNASTEPAPVSARRVFGLVDVDPSDVDRFGGKGAGLARMAAAGIAVPPAFVVTTDACAEFFAAGNRLTGDLRGQIVEALGELEAATGRRFDNDDGGVPLLVSVRSGAPVSMPGMMDTVLNVGLDAGGCHRLATATGDAAFAVDTWLRFWHSFGDLVVGIDPTVFDDSEVTAAAATARQSGHPKSFATLGRALAGAVERAGGGAVAEPDRQVFDAVAAVFRSWHTPRARAYREHHGIADSMGTAVTVQAMVFGNLGDTSGSGVAFSRNPNTGERGLFGEYLAGCQGEDLVSGVTTPVPVERPDALPSGVFEKLDGWARQLEAAFGDAVDIEFTVERSTLYLLQVRAAKRTAAAAVRIAADLIDEHQVTAGEAVQRVSVDQLRHLLRPAFDPAAVAAATVLATGIGSSPGHASGRAYVDSDRAAAVAGDGVAVLLVRPTTSPLDIRGMLAADGILTAKGGALSHAAVVSRAMDKPCVVGCEALEVDDATGRMWFGTVEIAEGTALSIDGESGAVYLGEIARQHAAGDESGIEPLLAAADELSGCEVWGPPRRVKGYSPAGCGPVSLTDVLIAAGRIDDLIAAIDALSAGGAESDLDRTLAGLAHQATASLIAESRGRPLDVRLPNLGSPRAQRMMSTWIGLAAPLLLPAGARALYRPLLRGIAQAARENDHDTVTAVVAGITDVRELNLMAAVIEGESTRLGAVLSSTGALAAAGPMIAGGYPVWIDVAELVRTYYGFPAALSLAEDAFSAYVAAGALAADPTRQIPVPLSEALHDLVAAAAARVRVGADCGSGAAAVLAPQLYDVGIRCFAAGGDLRQPMRLALAQHAVADPNDRIKAG